MAGKNTGVSTWNKGAIKFSGLPSPLDKTEQRTCRQIIQKEISVVNKVKILCFQKAKQISRKHLPAAQTKFWKEKLDTFFDISSCSCNLPILSCENINVKCTKENCQTKHIICTCPLIKKPTKKYEHIPTNSFNIICSGWFFPMWSNRGL